MEKYRILIVEDEPELADMVAELLDGYGYAAECVGSAGEAYDVLSKKAFHLVILDVGLPDSDGFEVCREIRRVSNLPIIFSSAKTGESDRVKGLDIGGDDYIPKPFSMKELLSRVNAGIRRTYGYSQADMTVTFGDVSVDIPARKVTKNGIDIPLSLREFDLLACLCRQKNVAVTKEKLLEQVWGIFNTSDPSTLTVHIRWLREKLEDDPQVPKYIKTVYKVGYILEDK